VVSPTEATTVTETTSGGITVDPIIPAEANLGGLPLKALTSGAGRGIHAWGAKLLRSQAAAID